MFKQFSMPYLKCVIIHDITKPIKASDFCFVIKEKYKIKINGGNELYFDFTSARWSHKY